MTSTNIAVPPIFVPPGLNRVPTPPMYDANGEVKDKLADFFFEHGAGIPNRKPKASPGGYHWDSDALLMSYLSPDMVLDSSTEEEGPEGPEGPITPSYVPRDFTIDRTDYGTPGLVTTPGGSYLDARKPYLSPPTSPDPEDRWFRIPNLSSTQLTTLALAETDERKKFEWIVPEHLPNSPLCPLHPNYKGYSIGICYWHGRRRSKASQGSKASEEFVEGVYELGKEEKRRRNRERKMMAFEEEGNAVRVRRGLRGWEVGMFVMSAEESRSAKKRRLESLSSP